MLQVGVLIAVVAFVIYLRNNLFENLDRLNIRSDFDFLSEPAGFSVANSDFRPTQPIRDVLALGAKNTAASAIVGVVLTTILGTVLGVARLSANWLLRKVAAVYVETLRNVPPLLVIVFLSLAVFIRLPPIARAYELDGVLVVSNKGVGIITPTAGERAGTFFSVLGVAVVVAAVLWVWRTRVQDRTGQPHHRVLWSGGVLILVGAIAFAALDGPIGASQPEVAGRQVAGGVRMLSGYLVVTIGLILYTASHVAELVRGSILAVPKGQSEAANAVALSEFQRLRFVVLPQAFRIAIPPLINQYLNLTKNTSLALAVGYAELTAITFITIGNGKPAPQLVIILMAMYLAFSIPISVFVNLLNRRLQLSERR
jgi:general L-amino acid transport system permease protein